MQPAEILPRLQPALAGFLAWLSGESPPAGETPEQLAKRYADLKGRLGRQAVAARLGFNEAELTAFDTALREGVRRVQQLAPDAPAHEVRNGVIAALRLLSWLETLQQRHGDLTLDLTLPDGSEELGRKQVRALELILRSLVSERYETQPRLLERLKALLSEKVVQQWLAAADRGDVLSGTTFSELASLFVSVQEFPGYEPLYRETPFLSLLREKRQTIRHFLDDIRRIRNLLAHNKRVTPLQVQLLDLYYHELVEPLQEAFDQGRSKVNPDLYLDASREELDGYFNGLKDDVRAVRDDLAELRADLTGRLDRLQEDSSALRAGSQRIEQGTRAANRKLKLVTLGLAALLALAGAGLYFGLETSDAARDLKRDTQETKELVEGMADGLRALANSGGLVAEPTTPAELYHNARLLAQRGESDRAIEVYRELFRFPLPYADPVIDLVTLLKAKYGTGGTGAALDEVLPPESDPRIRSFARLLAGAESVLEASARLEQESDPYLPELWAAAEGLMTLPHERFSYGLRKRTLAFLERVQAALGDGSLPALYLDQIRVEAIRQQLGGYLRQFPAGAAAAYDRPLDADWEAYDWVDGTRRLRVMLMWNMQTGAFNRVEPAELWVRFLGAEAPEGTWQNLFDPATAVAAQARGNPPDMELHASIKKMAEDLARDQNPMGAPLYIADPTGEVVLAEIKFVEVGGIARHLCLAIPNTDSDGIGTIQYRALADCGVE